MATDGREQVPKLIDLLAPPINTVQFPQHGIQVKASDSEIVAMQWGEVAKAESKQNFQEKDNNIVGLHEIDKEKDVSSKSKGAPCELLTTSYKRESPDRADERSDRHRGTRCTGRTPSQCGKGAYDKRTLNNSARHEDWRQSGRSPSGSGNEVYRNIQNWRESGRSPTRGGNDVYQNNQEWPSSERNLSQGINQDDKNIQEWRSTGRTRYQARNQDGQSDREWMESGRTQSQGGNYRNSDDFKPRIPGYREVHDLSLKQPSEVVLIMANTRKGYYDLLKGPLQADMMILVIKVLAKVCEVDFKENKTTVLASACNAKFLENLAIYIANIPSDMNPKRRAGIESFLSDLFLFCGTVMNLLPNTACEHLGPTLVLVKGAIASTSAYQYINFAEDLIEKQMKLEAHMKKLMEARAKKPVKESSRNETLKHQPPPDDFREMSIFPLPEDILTREKAFVRPNIVEGAYDSVDHYLDVQFRLLREDFVWPLREGITEYMQQLAVVNKPVRNKSSNIRIHENVTFSHSTVEKDKVGFVVIFDTNTTRFINWEHSKRFMFGSLLCFTNDNFASIMFGTVICREVGDLVRGRITVELTHESEMLDLFNSKFTMVESEVYFEPYYHVLKALQVMTAEDFPMARYIVHVQAETCPPEYTAEAPEYLYNIQEFQIPVLDEDAWPSANDLSLDDSQYQAFKSALTKEFVVIQGPPGTGKTYLGLKIAITIINNIKRILRRTVRHRLLNDDARGYHHHTPLLVVCFTNHALDQFLQGLLPATNNMVRIGGQSKSIALSKYNLKEIRYANRRQGDTLRLSKNIHERMSRLMSDMKGMQEDIQRLDTNYGIISIACIKEVYDHDANISCFIGDDGVLDDNLFLDWLVSEEDMYDFLPEEDLTAPEESDILPREDRDGQDYWLDDFDLDDMPVNGKLEFFLRLPSSREALEELRVTRNKLEEDSDRTLQMKLCLLEMHHHKCKYISHVLKKKHEYNLDAARQLMERNVYLWDLNSEQRWGLYFAWVAHLRTGLQDELRHVEARYRAEACQYQETQHMEDLQLLEQADVIGMTTTGAARLQPLLQALKCRVVIVEEAAEVMESHIVVSLTNHCQQLILIGDHQQLRPTTAVYKLARDFHLDISLFERMLRNGLHCEVLKVQHRMRPEIARLIVPSIYKELHNHESVLQYKPVQGVTKSLFFLTHNNREQEIGETHSRRNTFEADMLLRLCRYLLLQGYPPERITILTTYSGQMFYLRSQSNKSVALKDVQMTIVDNFQGEENDIILLSLVRNNEENIVGFLKTENRVCVALSRAKVGMFIMGNMDNLTSSSSIWPCIKEALDKQKAVGDCLTLYCPIHNDQLTEVRIPEDFDKVPEGGCQLPCATTLVCGHTCVRVCHAADREHKTYDCREPCTRTPPKCGLQHPCPRLCGAVCGDCLAMVERQLPCDHTKLLPCHVDHITYQCLEKVSITAADCGHTFEKPCHLDLESCLCPFPCDIRLDCGHSCARLCHVRVDPDHELYECHKECPKKNAGCTQEHMCARKCYETCGSCCVQVMKKAPTCDHVYTVSCSLDPLLIECKQRCEKTLPCGHPCRLLCYQECGDCEVMVKKKVIDSDCNHEVTIKCRKTPQRQHCSGPCQRSMSCGHRCNRSCKVACSDSNTCQELVESSVKPACGHDIQVHCNIAATNLAPDSPALLQHCVQPCNTELQCGHRCLGTCGLCLQGRVHQGCQAKCGRNLVCGHACSVPCAQACPPCSKKCRLRCVHSRCNRNCGEPCAKCQEPCHWQCPHKRCTKRCWQLCDRDPCNKPCKKILRCQHPCIGFCGEPCPPLCRVCNRDEVETIVFGQEDEPDARFVYLADCRHIIESCALETWLTQRGAEISMPQCPLCKTDITTTMRFMNLVKQVLKDVFEIKKKVFGEFRAIEARRTQLVEKLMNIKPSAATDHRTLARSRLNNRIVAISRVQSTVPDKLLTPSGEELFCKLQQQLQGSSSFKSRHRHQRHSHLSSVDLQSASIKLDIFDEVQKSHNEVRPHLTFVALEMLIERTDVILSVLLKRERMSPQEVADMNHELRRFHRIVQLCRLESLMRTQRESSEMTECYQTARGTAFSLQKYSAEQDDALAEAIGKLNDILKANMVVTETERCEIVAAVGMPRGHWFKCPNGHFYVIGECGGAMQVGKCLECGVEIGGTHHRLLPTNRFAPEMDGAMRSAWPGTDMNP